MLTEGLWAVFIKGLRVGGDSALRSMDSHGVVGSDVVLQELDTLNSRQKFVPEEPCRSRQCGFRTRSGALDRPPSLS